MNIYRFTCEARYQFTSPYIIKNTSGLRLAKARTATEKLLREENKKKFYDGFASPRKRN